MAAKSGTASVAGRCEAEILTLLRESLPANVADDLPIEGWYRTYHVEAGRGFSPFGPAIADFIDARRDRFDRVAEVGAGVGQTCVELAARGWPTMAIEPVERQWGLLERLLDRLAEVAPEVRARLEARRLAYPECAECFDARTVALFSGLGGRGPIIASEERAKLEGLTRAGAVIIEPEFFFRPREKDEQETLVKEIQSVGFAPPVLIWDNSTGALAHYYRRYRFLYFERLPSPQESGR